uniref:FYVE-type zinc finger domain-containing protein n=1 Tax=Plectus sambesii TaxID=2011161 RepID=A0A914XKP0_9BILA
EIERSPSPLPPQKTTTTTAMTTSVHDTPHTTSHPVQAHVQPMKPAAKPQDLKLAPAGLGVPAIQEIQATPVDPTRDMDEFYVDGRPVTLPADSAESDRRAASHSTDQRRSRPLVRYDSTEVSNLSYEDELAEEERIREIESKFAMYAENVLHAGYRQHVCPLCSQDTPAGKTCTDCSLVVCAHCGGVDHTRKLWMCAMCAVRRELQTLTDLRSRRKERAARSAPVVSAHETAQSRVPPKQTVSEPPRLAFVEDREREPSQLVAPAAIPGKTRRSRKTDHAEDEDSGGETSPSSDEEDYPDEIIEAPTAPSLSIDEVERERERQEAIGSDVLHQIQMFGESANDEFDVTWATRTLESSTARMMTSSAAITVPSSTTVATSTVTVRAIARPVEAVAGRGHHQPSVAVPVSRAPEPEPRAYQSPLDFGPSSSSGEDGRPSRKNPFLSPDEDTIDLDLNSDTEHGDEMGDRSRMEEDDIDYAQAAKYYHNQPFYTHRPGPVYTIPEDDEEDDVMQPGARNHI